MTTILCDCEAIINSRPLGYLGDDPTQLKPLTPMHFLQEISQNEVPDLDRLEVNLNKRMRYRQSLRNDLRKRFRSEYLGQLSRRNKNNSTLIKEGDIVLLGQDNLKRLDWPLARVIKVFPGKDCVVRVVKVKTASGEVVRPVQRLYPLEICTNTARATEQSTDTTERIQDVEQDTIERIKDMEQQPATLDTVKEVRTRSSRHVKTPKKFEF
ncbi:PREDICTED: uncharacterized protein LOC108777479 [Cyphomyrmex costatus]|uniref:uncharacterized protein LOC108777479 n=1 Tax=Cyphomyrmex costatus TaxID=456900 RepID=UPI0008522BBF|nr:PREDICTED: uncharacterized protein LOC108777479 [Cyphomyrmex costatus]